MLKTFFNIIALLFVSFFTFLGCEDKTVVTKDKAQVVQDKSLPQKIMPQGEIETH